MYATRTRRARPEPFALRPGIAERLGLPYMDAGLGFAAFALVAFGVFTLGEATKQDVPGNPGYYVDRQAIYAVLGLAGMYLLARIDYSRFRELRVGIYTFLCASVSLVFVFGFAARGSRRAFELPFFSFQPSELGKLLLVLALAGFVIDGARRGSARQRTVRYLCLGFAPAALVFLQPDLGTSLVYGAITLAVMYVGGVRWTHFAVIGAALVALVALVLVVAPAIGTPVLKEYQQQRLTSFTHPSADPSDAGYQQNQAKIAIGSGEKTGRGNRATQTRLDFVPERHTDFIFAVIGERYGFPIRPADLAGAADCDALEELIRDPCGRRHRRHAAFPGLRQCGDEPGDHADHRDSPAAAQLRGFLRAGDVTRGGSASEHSHASAPQPERQVRLVTP
jgi:rod shape determining protein RodA